MLNIFVVILACFLLQVRADCPDGYVRHDNSCYRLHHNKFTWPEAMSFCRAYNAHLVKIEDHAELNFLKAEAKEAGAHFSGDGYWTGASDALINNEWIWTESGERMTLNGDWAPGEPDQQTGRDCLGLWKTYDYNLGAWDCRHLLMPICEVDPYENSIGPEIIG